MVICYDQIKLLLILNKTTARMDRGDPYGLPNNLAVRDKMNNIEEYSVNNMATVSNTLGMDQYGATEQVACLGKLLHHH